MIHGYQLTIAIAIVIIVFFVLDFYYMAKYDHERKTEKKGWGLDYTLFAIAFGCILFLQPIILPKLGWTTSAFPGLLLQIFGIVLIILGFALHNWARAHLRQFYVERVEVQEQHKIIETGPYALMRHPVFTAFFLLAWGVFFLNPAITTILSLVYVLWDFSKSARQEESLLSKEVPGYSEYMAKVPRFFPRLFRVS